MHSLLCQRSCDCFMAGCSYLPLHERFICRHSLQMKATWLIGMIACFLAVCITCKLSVSGMHTLHPSATLFCCLPCTPHPHSDLLLCSPLKTQSPTHTTGQATRHVELMLMQAKQVWWWGRCMAQTLYIKRLAATQLHYGQCLYGNALVCAAQKG